MSILVDLWAALSINLTRSSNSSALLRGTDIKIVNFSVTWSLVFFSVLFLGYCVIRCLTSQHSTLITEKRLDSSMQIWFWRGRNTRSPCSPWYVKWCPSTPAFFVCGKERFDLCNLECLHKRCPSSFHCKIVNALLHRSRGLKSGHAYTVILGTFVIGWVS